MKKDKEKRKHHESTIGKIIYGFLLFLPLLAISVTCGYAMFNKNAYKNYSGNENIETQYIHSINDFIVNEQYIFNSNSYTSLDNVVNGGNQARITFSNIEIINTNFTFDLTNLSQIGFYKTSTNNYAMYLYDNLGNSLGSGNNSTSYIIFSGYYVSNNLFPSWVSETNLFYKITNQSNNYIDNVFYYSVDTVEQSNLFNWAKTSMIYTGMLNFTTAMNVTNTFMPMLLTYWLIISVIYFLYDIVLIILVVLHRKIHELQESI